MKKFGLFLIGAVATIILLSQIGPMIGLVISAAVLYFAYKQFAKATSKGAKFWWGVAGVIMLVITASNLPAIIGVVAAYVLYLVMKKWNNNKQVVVKTQHTDDPFVNFENQWSKLTK
ncbi:flagellar basal body rod protein [Bacillus sp. B1-b2]|uniref:lmo0954 family membrane protein n=1 Tax=Bacillus sp. B1-b2 TaxID=2653201 RepID=UPI001261889E|nr:flagellar basal body rod protein [Bacillus sp. B1-b2]KAB7672501.1 flagellar basal body rod protein [Bacillus sp. B1-b2]